MRARGLTAAEIAVILGTTEASVAMKCCRLRITSAAAQNSKQWTADQIDELRDMYGRGFTALQIAKAMGRTLKSVYGQTYRLGLSREQAGKRRMPSGESR